MKNLKQTGIVALAKTFKSKSAQNTAEYLEAARLAEVYIAQNMHESGEGYYWTSPGVKDEIDLSFYSGCAGIVYFYLNLYQVCPDSRYQEIAMKGIRYLASHWKDSFHSAAVYDYARPGAARREFKKGFYFGASGIGLIFLEAYRSFRDPVAAEGAAAITNYYIASQKAGRSGVHWSISPAIAMDSGIILYLLDYYSLFPDDGLKNLLRSAGEHLLSMGKRQKSGTLLYKGYGNFLPYSTPNWEFGNAGSGYALAKLYEFTGDPKFLQAAIDAANHILEVRVPQEKGCLLPMEFDPFGKNRRIFYAGLCYGPAGTSRLFYYLYCLTEDDSWYEPIIEMADGLESAGVPETQMSGLWNNMSYCCGHGGLVHFFLSLYQSSHDERWHDLALRSASIILGEMNRLENGGVNWQIAWSRVQPDRLSEPIGFFDGAAGLATVLLEMYLTEERRFSWRRLIDDPFNNSIGQKGNKVC